MMKLNKGIRICTVSQYRVYFAMRSSDVASCQTLEDARIRQKEIADNQAAKGFTAEKTIICREDVTSVMDDDMMIVSESKVVTRVE